MDQPWSVPDQLRGKPLKRSMLLGLYAGHSFCTVQAKKVRLDIKACSVKQPACTLVSAAVELGGTTHSNQGLL